MKDFSKAKIFKLTTSNDDIIYIGATCIDLDDRLYNFKKSYRCYLNGNENYVTAFDIIESGGDLRIELIENCPPAGSNANADVDMEESSSSSSSSTNVTKKTKTG